MAVISGVSIPTIKRLEASEGDLGGRASTADKIIAALEKAGVEFLNHGQPGVRLKLPALTKKPEGPATDAVDAMVKAIEKDQRR